jgi:hypothetical protein
LIGFAGRRLEASHRPATVEAVLPPEPVSPELVLVDPDLARRERARLEERAYLETVVATARGPTAALPAVDVATLRRVVETSSAPDDEMLEENDRWRHLIRFTRRRLLPAALMCSLLLKGFLVADLVAGKGPETVTPVAARVVASREALSSRPSTRSLGPTAPVLTGKPAAVAQTKTSVERRLVSLILAAPVAKLPRRFVDSATGLVKNNVQVVCSRNTRRSFLCAVRLPGDRPSQGIHVRYRMRAGGKGFFQWLRDRSGDLQWAGSRNR